MYFITFVLVTTLSVLSLFTPSHCIRTAKSPRYLFSNEANIIQDSSEDAFVGSQDLNERFKRYSDEDVQPNTGHSRSRRAADFISREPTVNRSQELCRHDNLVIQWSREADRVTSNGNIVALCKKGKNDKSTLSSVIFVSYNHGSTWNNVTTLFTNAASSSSLSIEKFFIVKERPKFMIFPDAENKRIFYTSDGLKTIGVAKGLVFKPESISINPGNPSLVIASNGNHIYLSKDGSKTYKLVKHFNEVTAYYWGVKEHGDNETDIFAEGKVPGSDKTQGYKVDCSNTGCKRPQLLTDEAPLNGDITDFLVKNEYMFCTKMRDDKNGVDLYVKYLRGGNFVKAKVVTTRPMRELFIFDISGGVVMIVANLRKNETNLYTSLNISGTEYSLSLPRVLYHNPKTDVSSHWLRLAISYRFVDVLQVKGLPSVYFATQLTVGPVGGRYLISVVTFDKGGVWKPIRGPGLNKYGSRCLYPKCSLHINLFYGSIYRYSQTTPLMSRASAPGLIMTTGVLGANLKITPDTYISRDGGNSFEKVLRGKRHFAFGDHGGFVVASPYTQSQNLQYSYDFKQFTDVKLLPTGIIQIKKILTEPGETGVVFLVMGTVRGAWRLFQVNATKTLGPICTKQDFQMVNVSDGGVGGCVITTIQQRNASTQCRTGLNYSKVITKSYEGCVCRRADYICDYKFKPNRFNGGCQLIEGKKLPIPNFCPEGTKYTQTQGYVKIKDHNCVDDDNARSLFNPKKIACPDKLSGLVMTGRNFKNGTVIVAIDTVLNLTATLKKGNMLQTKFDWRINGIVEKTCIGLGCQNFLKNLTKHGLFIISLKVSSNFNYIRTVIILSVIGKVEKNAISISYSPILPSVKEKVTLIAMFVPGVEMRHMGLLHYKWIINSVNHIKTNNAILMTTFNKTGQQTVSVSIYNKVSHAIETITVMVTKDLKVTNVRLFDRNGLILVQWDAVIEPLYNILGYKVMYRKLNDAFYLEASCIKSRNLECLITNVTAYTKYQVKVSAVAGNGYGPPSDVATILTPPTLPGVPTKVSLVIEESTKVVASWQPPLLPNGKIRGYKFKFYKNIQDATVITISDPNVFTKTFSGLDVDVDYHFEVAVTNEIGIGRYSEVISVRTGIDKPTEPPTNFQALQVKQTSAKLTWNRPKIRKNSNIYFSPKGYVITAMQGKDVKVDVKTSELYYMITKLEPNTNYTCTVAAYITKYDGPPAKTWFVTLMAPPKPPKKLRSVRTTATSVTLSWTAPPSQPGVKLSYEVYQIVPVPLTILGKTIKTQYIATDLEPYTRYLFGVKTVNEDGGKSLFSNELSLLTSPSFPGISSDVEVTERWPTSSSVRVSWGPPDKPNGIITKYLIRWGISGQAIMKKKLYNAVISDKMFIDIDHLTQETKYVFEVVAYTSVGAGLVEKVKHTTRYYPFGSEHILIPFMKPKIAEKLSRDNAFPDNFIKIVQHRTSIPKERFANVRLNTKLNAVEFELISREEKREEGNDIVAEMDHVKALLAPSFDTSGRHDLTKPNAVESVKQHIGQPSTGKSTSSSNTAAIVGIGCACAVIIAILVAALIIIFRRYRSTSMYNKFDSQVQYNNENSSHNVDGEVEMRRGTHNYRHNKDIETVPLADADELT